MKIVCYRSARDIDVEFENGLIRNNITYSNFKKGAVYGGGDYEKFKDVKDRVKIEDVLELLKKDLTQKECAEILGVDRTTLNRYLKEKKINHEFKRYKDIIGLKFGKLLVLKDMGLNEDLRKISSVYRGMKNRCLNKKASDYKHYGGRGICICDEWLGAHGFKSFYNWSINNGFKMGLSIERINVNGNYEPSNCSWITMKEQSRNKRNTRYLTINKTTKNLSEWVEELNINKTTLIQRYEKFGDNPEFLLTKKKFGQLYIEINGEEKSVGEWARVSNLNPKTIYQRYTKLKWRGEKLLKKSTKQ